MRSFVFPQHPQFLFQVHDIYIMCLVSKSAAAPVRNPAIPLLAFLALQQLRLDGGHDVGAGMRGESIEAPALPGSSRGNRARSRPPAGKIPPSMAASNCAPGSTDAGAGAGAGASAAAAAERAARGMPSAIAAEQSSRLAKSTCLRAAASRAAEGFALFLRALRSELRLVMLIRWRGFEKRRGREVGIPTFRERMGREVVRRTFCPKRTSLLRKSSATSSSRKRAPGPPS